MGWRRLFHRDRRDAELAKDIQFYLDAETEDNIARGMPIDIARRRALTKFGNTTLVREEVYRMNSLPFFETLWQDGLHGMRQLRRSASFTAVAAITLALTALALTAVGVFGVMAYSVSQRTHEVGIRMAPGAKPGDVLLLAVRQGMFVTTIGLGIGIVGSAAVTRLLSGFLYEVKSTDFITFLGALALLTGVALLACYLPARSAARVDPLVALRNE